MSAADRATYEKMSNRELEELRDSHENRIARGIFWDADKELPEFKAKSALISAILKEREATQPPQKPSGPRIVILGSLRDGEYTVTYPIRNHLYNTEEGYKIACERFYPAIDVADMVLVYGEPGEHTQRDIDYAISKGKTVIYLSRAKDLERRAEEAESELKTIKLDWPSESWKAIPDYKSPAAIFVNRGSMKKNVGWVLDFTEVYKAGTQVTIKMDQHRGHGQVKLAIEENSLDNLIRALSAYSKKLDIEKLSDAVG